MAAERDAHIQQLEAEIYLQVGEKVKLREEVARLRAALEPFAKFELSGFDGEVLEVVPSTPDNPSPRIEPIWSSHFRRARTVLGQA